MSQNIWDAQSGVNNDINRNSFDWSHINNFTAKFGYYYPMLTQFLPANSKWECNPYLGMQLMPMQYPVQTPLKARMSFFKVPLRTLWSDYMDFVSNFRDDIEVPYHDIQLTDFNSFFGECQLGDYLEIPNVVYGDEASYPKFTLYQSQTQPYRYGIFVDNDNYISFSAGARLSLSSQTLVAKPLVNNIVEGKSYIPYTHYISYQINEGAQFTKNEYTLNLSNLPTEYKWNMYLDTVNSENNDIFNFGIYTVLADANYNLIDSSRIQFNKGVSIHFTKTEQKFNDVTVRINSSLTGPGVPWDLSHLTDEQLSRIKYLVYLPTLFIEDYAVTYSNSCLHNTNLYGPQFLNNFIPLRYVTDIESNYRVITPDDSPYYSSDANPDGLKLNSYRARAYEAIYNAYFRDPRNNPLIVDGKEVYNKWLPNYDGGADTTPYKLRKANWEKDFLTTAVRSPQQGKQPLVGLTQYVDTSVDPDNPNGLSYKLALVDENGNKYQIKYVVDDTSSGQPTVEVGDILPDNQAVDYIDFSKMLNATNYGISIPDFRVVNAYQKFLELNLRKGYSYKDIVEGRFDCKVKFDELLMPEYLGGFTREINMNRVVQSFDVNLLGNISDDSGYGGSLGALAGDGYLSTDNVPKISCFCDEECIIMGILSVVPTPAYSQLIPKDFFYRDLLDHFQPEFAQVGYQPITYKEICPLQCKAFGVDFDETFGYQRSWYEYVQKQDTVHGLLRSNLRNFIMNRNFESVPRLTEDFLLVDPEQLNDVFQVTEDTDKIVGQCKFDIQVQLPIPRVSIPRLD